MTTVAYKNGIIACDSFAVADRTIVDDDTDKRIVRDGVTFVFCGRPDQYDEFITAYFSETRAISKDNECGAIVYDGDKLWCTGVDNDKVFKYHIKKNKTYAIGSGQDHAWTAMDLGASAPEAVKAAAKRDTCTGGEVRIVKVK